LENCRAILRLFNSTARAVCRIEIEPRPYALKGPSFAALLYVIDGGDAIHPVMSRDDLSS